MISVRKVLQFGALMTASDVDKKGDSYRQGLAFLRSLASDKEVEDDVQRAALGLLRALGEDEDDVPPADAKAIAKAFGRADGSEARRAMTMQRESIAGRR
jgi:hypothetical protein